MHYTRQAIGKGPFTERAYLLRVRLPSPSFQFQSLLMYTVISLVASEMACYLVPPFHAPLLT